MAAGINTTTRVNIRIYIIGIHRNKATFNGLKRICCASCNGKWRFYTLASLHLLSLFKSLVLICRCCR